MGDSCIIPDCHVRFRDGLKPHRVGRNLDTQQNSWLKSILIKDALSVETGSKICKNCYQKYLKKRPRPDTDDGTQYDDVSELGKENDLPENVATQDLTIPLLSIFDLKYASSSHRRCSLCLEYNDNCVSIPKSVRHFLVIKHQLWCSPDARVCPEIL